MIVSENAISQTAPGSQIINQGIIFYKYKNFPVDTLKTNTIAFSVLDAPNFDLSYGTMETKVFAKETVIVSLVYKNVGNKTADSATVEVELPMTGISFVNGPSSAIITGKTAQWKIYNIGVGKEDSVSIKAVVDGSAVLGSTLLLTGTIYWETSQQNTTINLLVSDFARLTFQMTSADTIIGSGREAVYQYRIRNTGNTAAANVVLTDSLFSTGRFVSASITPQNISVDKNIITWNLPNIAGLSETVIQVTLRSLPNLSFTTLVNSGSVTASNVTQPAFSKKIIHIVPVLPKSISVSPAFKYLFGQANRDSTVITALIKDSLQASIPDGTPVVFHTTRGTFSNASDTFTVVTANGKAATYLRSSDIQNDKVTVSISATAGTPSLGTITDSTQVIFYPGAVTGIVINGLNYQPISGAIATVRDQAESVVDRDTTKNDGRFFIALNKIITKYSLEISVRDKFGDTITSRTIIDPNEFPRPAIIIPNIISGRIQYQTTGDPVPAEGINVFLDSLGPGPILPLKTTKNSSRPNYARIKEQQTDSRGKFIFENLYPGIYRVAVDSTQFPSYAGFKLVPDTINGSFLINLSIDIKPDTVVAFSIKGKNIANAGDTLLYTLSISNNGNLTHFNAAVTDTIPKFLKFVSTNNGGASMFVYDSIAGIFQWHWDSLQIGKKDSVTLKTVLSRNIPDSTIIRNSAYFSSSIVTTPYISHYNTLIRSLPVIQFGINFAGRDSVTAGDTVQTKIWYSNTGTDSLRGVKIIDSLYASGMTRLTFRKSSADSAFVVDSVFVKEFTAIPPGVSDTITVTMVTDFTLRKGNRILSSARLMKDDSTLAHDSRILTFIDAQDLSTFIKIEKNANKKVAEIGDIVTYQITVTNASPSFFYNVGIYDILPHSFTYIKKSARFNNIPVEPSRSAVSGVLIWNLPDTVQRGKPITLVYQLAVGADALESDGINRAYASAVGGAGPLLVSNSTEWQITVRPGVFTEKGLIIGKVFYDDDRNTFQSEGENGIKGVELWMEDGTRIVTGDDGKYSLPEVKPGQHVIRVNEASLPAGTALLGGSTDFAMDPVSRFVRVTEGGIAKANFFVKRNLKDSLQIAVKKSLKASSRRVVVPKYIYTNDTLHVKLDTITVQVSFTYSGEHYLQQIDVVDILPLQFTIIPGSALFNGRKTNPVKSGDSIVWRLGRGGVDFTGNLEYKMYVNSFPKTGTRLRSSSIISIMTSDSIFITSKPLVTDNVVMDTTRNLLESSVIDKISVFKKSPGTSKDTMRVKSGDEIQFNISIFIDPKKKAKSVIFIDSLRKYLLFNDKSFTVNGIPVQSNNLAINTISEQFSALGNTREYSNEQPQISFVDVTKLILNGENILSYSAIIRSNVPDTIIENRSYLKVVDSFNEITISQIQPIRISLRNSGAQNLPSPPVFKEPKRPKRKPGKYYDLAMKIIGDNSWGKNAFSDSTEFLKFIKNTDLLLKSSIDFLDDLILALEVHPEISIQINGYADNKQNSKQENFKLSLKRSAKIKEYLLDHGIDTTRLFFRGLGYKELHALKIKQLFNSKNQQIEFVVR
ncbi:MAG: DUF11 domain-containing protein [Bacteroidetes bacterium]|nr:DUF11 domain-containing protein [Bacteroidota bacterium]